jgi:CubicO group peptidase (beta-lactamase class C family)
MQNRIQELLDASPVTGCAVAIIEPGEITVYCVGEYADQEVSEQTIWAVASLTKPVFVYGVLQLAQKGLLDLDRPLQEYLPMPYVDGVDDLPLMTARHTMTHSTGFPNWRDAEGLRAAFRPGTKFSYSSEGLNYLQTVVEHLLGTTMQDYLREHVFLPFGMLHTELGGETEETVPPFASFFLKTLPANGALSLRTTIADYARFIRAMFEPSDASHLSESVRKEMLMPQIGVGMYSDLKWGLGWGLQQVNDESSFWHWGARSIPQTMNFAVGWPEQEKGIVIFTNHGEGLYLCRDIVRSVFPQDSLPAFEWLLPAKNWRPDGTRPITT